MKKESSTRTVPALSRTSKVLLLVFRLLMGAMLLEEGLTKLLSGTFSSAEFLTYSTGPFSAWYVSLAPCAGFFDPLVTWTQILMGLALLAGFLVRPVSLCAAVMMLVFYLAYLPSPYGWISYALVYTVLFVLNLFSGSGYIRGLDRRFFRLEQRRSPWRCLFG